MSEVCDGCPFIAACDVARELADNPNHPKTNDVLGGIDATEFALRSIVKRVGCDEPVSTRNGQLVCPNDNMAMFARGMGVQTWPNTQVQLHTYRGIMENGLSHTEDVASRQTPGQYI